MWQYGVMGGMLALAGYWVSEPLRRPTPLERVAPPEPEDRKRALQGKKEEVYAAIKEMEFDYGMGKISEEDLRELTSQYKAQALEIMKEAEAAGREVETVEKEIEQEIRRVRATRKEKSGRGNARDAAQRMNFCPQCGNEALPESKFCPFCGERLARLAEGRSVG